MTRKTFIALLLALLAISAPGAKKDGHTGTKQSSRLYTDPDGGAGGGIKLRIERPVKNMIAAFAIPQFEPRFVYKGFVSNGDAATFTGLPSARYDLVLVFEDSFYEGCRLSRDEDHLTSEDRASIKTAITNSTHFFNLKEIHRMSGTTGRDGEAMCVLQEMRTDPVTLQSAEVRSDIQIRSIKLAMMDQVGPAWSLTQTREIIRQEVAGSERKGLLPCYHAPALSGVRVTDSTNDLGLVDLAKR